MKGESFLPLPEYLKTFFGHIHEFFKRFSCHIFTIYTMYYVSMFTRLFCSMSQVQRMTTVVLPEPGGHCPSPIFGKSVNPILTTGADSANPLLLAPPIFFTFRHHCFLDCVLLYHINTLKSGTNFEDKIRILQPVKCHIIGHLSHKTKT